MMQFLSGLIFTWMFLDAQMRVALSPEHLVVIWPDDKLETLFVLAELSTRLRLPRLSSEHYAFEVNSKSRNVEELFHRLEIAIRCLRHSLDSPSVWNPKVEVREYRPLVEFSYSVKYGYREPYEIHKILLEKISILHYLIESQTEEQKELYYPYYINEFASVVDDTIDVLSLFFELV